MPYGQEKSVGVVRSADEVLDRLDGDPGGDLAGRVSAHAVGDDEQPQILGADEAVFVHVTNGAGFAQAECLHDVLARAESTTLSRWTYYFSGSDTSESSQYRWPEAQSAAIVRVEDPAEARTAQASLLTSCARESTPTFSKIRDRCFFVVAGVMPERGRDVTVAISAEHQLGDLDLAPRQVIALLERGDVRADLADADGDVAVASAQIP